MVEECPICLNLTANIHHNPIRHEYHIGCNNCGVFSLSIVSKGVIEQFKEKHKLACLLRERRTISKGQIFILSDNDFENLTYDHPTYKIQDLIYMFPDSISECLDRTLVNLSKLSNFPGSQIDFNITKDKSLFFTQSNEDEEAFFLLQQLIMDELINGKTVSPTKLKITVQGWNKIADLERNNTSNSNRAFVAMWFDKQMNSPYDNAIAKAVKDAGYIPIRIDKVDHNNKIDDQIIAEIKRSKFVISDFTGQRGGVYFEAGFAMGFGKPVIWTVREDELNNVHFDTRQYSHIVWEKEEDLYDKLLNRIRATIQ